MKARYHRYLETKQCEAWRNIDLVSDMSKAGGEPNTGAGGFVADAPSCIDKNSQPTVHHVQAAEVQPISATTAGGLCALTDVVRLIPRMTTTGYSHHHETYEKSGGERRIRSAEPTRLRKDIFNMLFGVRISGRMTEAGAYVLPRRRAR